MAQPPLILVTGATSYIASYIIKTLLDRNYKLRATVRSLTSPTVRPIRALDPSALNLELVQADMADTQIFPSLVSGVYAAIHCAIPMFYSVDGSNLFETPEEAYEKQVQPTLTSTKALFEAAAAANVQKIVLTSSLAAMIGTPKQPDVVDESCWSDEQFFRENIMAFGTAPYGLAKTLQEKLAWKLSESLNLKVVSINPAFVWGPSLIERLNASLDVLLTITKGSGSTDNRSTQQVVPNQYTTFVDIREVALAHVLAFENDDAEGRYLLASTCEQKKNILRVLRENPAFAKLPDYKFDDTKLNSPWKLDCSKVRSLGVAEIPWEETIRDSAKSLVDGGHVV